MSITAENLVWRIGGKTIVDNVSFAAEPGRMLGLLGPNGSGKTSLLRLLTGLKRPQSGRVLLEGSELATLGARTVARRVAFVEQHATTSANLSVADVVRLGRFPHRSWLSRWTHADDRAVDEALVRAGMQDRRNDRWQSLSGGEKQRTHIARALAQTPTELILDEPTNHLDIQHQIGVLKLVASLPITSVVALHDLNHAAMFCDRVIVMQQGKIVTSGPPESVITEALLRDVFAVEARVETSPHHQRPHIHYLR
ncbi:ABC transporter ATP-binding protein [Bosea sp. F3-2]|uniref:ABC transporter ATP-binding protein n=1 Tax=Bosea sp. F3-2 TaxID=2599640 RepID=UPI0011EEB17A|nr:ABC transporter ATP-binding protein [Bosea sp. F3-2]QEL25161.1 ABC transporter ATP-binding protein [Bosea sp. F3-2]